MQKIFIIISLAAVSLGLGACSSAPSVGTYEAINTHLGDKPARQAPVASDDAVANALVPPVAILAEQLPKARQALDERFNVSFNGVPATQFFNSIVVGTRYNMLVHPDVSGTITANLKNVTLFEALDAVREMYGYDYKVDGTRIYVKPLTMQTRMFQVNYLIGNRKGSSSLSVTSTSVSSASNNGSGSGNNGNNNSQNGNNGNNNNNNGNNNQNGGNGNGNGSSQGAGTTISTSSTNDFWAELKAAVEAIVGKDGGRSVVISPQSGVIVIRAMPEELRNVDAYLKATQLSVDRQVILEAKIIEVELNSSVQSGINWASFASFRSGHDNRVSTGFLGPGGALAPLPFAGGQPAVISGNGAQASTGFSLANAASPGSLFALAFQTSNFAALLSFLESQGTVHVLSSPRVSAMNNQKAVLKIGTDEFFVTGVTSTQTTAPNGSNTSTPSVNVQPFFSGVVLDVTPQIDDKGNIILHVHPSVSQVSTVVKAVDLGSAGSLSLPLAASATSEMDSLVRGQDGQVVVIGGLMRQSTTDDSSQLPGVGSLPILGALFRNKNQVVQKRELVVLIKPTIVDGANTWNEDLLDVGRRVKELDPRTGGHK